MTSFTSYTPLWLASRPVSPSARVSITSRHPITIRSRQWREYVKCRAPPDVGMINTSKYHI
eukprot:2045690-Pyramimonas_sp.AAC.1